MKPAGEMLRPRSVRIRSLSVALACASLLFAGITPGHSQTAAQIQAQQARERQEQAQEAAQQRQQQAEEARERQQQAQEAAQQRQQQAEEARERQQQAQEAAQQRQQQAERQQQQEAAQRQQQAQAAQQRQQQQEAAQRQQQEAQQRQQQTQAAAQRQQQEAQQRQQEAEAQRRAQQQSEAGLRSHLPEPIATRPQLPYRTVDVHPAPVRPEQPHPVILPPAYIPRPVAAQPGRGFEPARPVENRPVVVVRPGERPVLPALGDRRPAPVVLVQPSGAPVRAVIVGGRIRPAAQPIVVAPAVVVTVPQRVVARPNVTTVLALGNVQPGNNAYAQAQAQMRAAQATCAQATQFANTVNGQAASAQALNQGVDAMLQLLADNTSDPDMQSAIASNIGRPDPINDALQQQLQNLALVSAQNCDAQTTAAQQAMDAVQGNISSLTAPLLIDPTANVAQAHTSGFPGWVLSDEFLYSGLAFQIRYRELQAAAYSESPIKHLTHS